MVGLTISMIVVLGMLAVFKTTTLASATTGKAATTDRQRLSGLFTAQKVLQGAGFGIDAASFGRDLIVLSGATLSDTGALTGTPVASLPASGNAIVWGSKVSGTYKCQGLYAPTNPTSTTGALIRLPEVDCANAAAYAGVAWASPSMLIEDDRGVGISVRTATACQVFGITGGGGLWAVLTTRNSIEGSNGDVSSSACLVGFA